MLDSGHYLWCAFICQQALEKLLKAGYVKREKRVPPYIHKLERLLDLMRMRPPQEILDIFILIDKYYIVARYPSYKKSVDIKTKIRAEEIYKNTKRAYVWLQEQMELK